MNTSSLPHAGPVQRALNLHGTWPWLPLAAGLLALYLPTLVGLLQGVWRQDGQMHGPVVLTISLWLLLRNWGAMQLAVAKQTGPGLAGRRVGAALVGFALLLYVVGRTQDILLFEVGSLVWMLAGLALLGGGAAALRAQWFGLFFMLFMVPLPGAVVDLLTLPMKMGVSYVAEQILYVMGYPISRTGVTLQVGQYALLVADACAGLHTLLTLEALGLLYLNLIRRDSTLRNISLALLIVPISFASNVIRVIVLCMVTFHMGDAAGQGFLHWFAGMVLFLSALMLIILADSLLHGIERLRARLKARQYPRGTPSSPVPQFPQATP